MAKIPSFADNPSPLKIAAMICNQLEKGIPEDQILESINIDTEFGVNFQTYLDFILDNKMIVKDEKTGKYEITDYGKEIINTFLPKE